MKHLTRKDLQNLADVDGFICRHGKKTPTLKIWPDGTINRADVNLELVKDMSVAEACAALNIKIKDIK